jgi:DNA helicase HerA-like ATPase
MNTLFRRLRDDVSVESLRTGVDESSMSQNQKNLANTRIDFAESFVRDGGGVAHHVRPGRLVIVDIRDELIEQDEALAVFMVLLNRFGQVEDGAAPFNKMIVFDEAHKYMGNTRLTQAIVENIRLMRHRGTTVVLASQDPPSVPKEVIELSSIVVAHRFTSPKWLDHIRRVNSAFGESAMQPSQLARLEAGEAFVWSVGGAEAFRRPQRVIMRPRLARHGGGTRRAV